MTGTTRGPKPTGLTRLFLRLPIWLYRWRLGWLLGGRFVMIRHTGRKSGLPRDTVIELVHYRPETDTYFIASGWGEKADWFRNIQKTPTVLLFTRNKRLPALTRRLSTAEAADILARYATLHPTSFRQLSKMMIGEALTNAPADCRRLAAVVPVVAIAPMG
ncbi:MAG: nitroreductase family deazaflavin-dependent oxidoreductase [Caldilineaceae bacterium]